MADPLTIIGGIAAIGQATAAVIKGTKFLHRLADKAGVLSEDVEFFASHITAFGSTISTTHSAVRDHYLQDRNSVALRRLHQHTTLNTLASQSIRLMKRMKEAQPQLKHGRQKMGVLTRVQWMMKEKDRSTLCVDMGRVQANFQLIFLQIIYETLQQRASNPTSLNPELFDFRREMKKTRHMMRNQMKAIQAMKHKQASSDFRQNEEDSNIEVSFGNVERAILDMGEEVVMERAPSSTVSSPVTSTVSSNTTSNTTPTEARRIVLRRTDPIRNVGVIHSIPPARLVVPSSVTERPAHLPIPDTVPAPPNPAQISRTEILSQTVSVEDTEVESPLSNDGDYIAVHEDIATLRLDPERNSEAVTGYINTGTRPVTALLNPEFSQNIISREKVIELGLSVEELEEYEVENQVDFGRGEQMVTGKARFVWKKAPGQTNLGEKPLKITCLVCESTPAPIIFGQRFLERRRHYWRV